jgi:hypothetical protein
MNIIIDNLNYRFHFEILESIIIKYDYIIKKPKSYDNQIYLENISSNDYIKYINNKYPNIKVNQKPLIFDYKIYSTIYSNLINNFNDDIKKDNIFFISHDISDKSLKFNNIFYLTPLCNCDRFIYCNILPSIEYLKKKQDYPIYAVQGNFTSARRNYNLLCNILKYNYHYDFKIKFIGRGTFPEILIPYKSKIIIAENRNFINYHNEFSDCYGIIPLTTIQSHPNYYNNKLTSTINYAMAYDLVCIIDKDLQNIYKLKNVEIFNNENDIKEAFVRSLDKFYSK